MNGNLAYSLENAPREQMIGGRLVAMSPRPTVSHNRIAVNVFEIFDRYLEDRPYEPFPDGVDLYLSETDRFVPDGMVVCDPDKVKWNRVEGAPDLVVEVLSPGTARYDRGHKMAVYERFGVREYWIVSPAEMSVEQYVLEDGAFALRDIFNHYHTYMLECMSEEERTELVREFPCAIFPDLSVRLEDVFYRVKK